MSEEQIELAEFTINFDKILNGAIQLKERMEELKEEQKALVKSGDTVSEAYVSNEATLKALNAEYRQHVTALSKSSEEAQVMVAREEQLSAVFAQEAVSINEARQQVKELTALRNSANVTTAEGLLEVDKLNKAIDANNAFIKDNVDELSKQKINVGNYAGEIKNAVSQLNPFNGGLQGMIGFMSRGADGAKTMSVAFKTLTASIRGAIVASLAFLATPIGAAIGAIGAVIGILYTGLTSTQEGMDKLAEVTEPVKAVFEALKGTVQELASFLIDNLGKAFKFIGGVIDAIKNRDLGKLWTTIKEGAVDVADSAKKGLKIFTDMPAKMKRAVEIGKQIADQKVKLADAQLALSEQEGGLNIKLQEQRRIQQDITKTDAERLAAGEEAKRISQEIVDLKLAENNAQAKIAELTAELNDTTKKDQIEINKLKKEGEDIIAANTKKDIDINNKQNSIKKQAVLDRIKHQEELLELYKTEQGEKAKTLLEEVEVAREVAKRQEEILKNKLKNGLISETAYKNEVLKIKNELADQTALAAANETERVIEGKKREIEERRAQGLFLSEEEAEKRKQENDSILADESDLALQKLEAGILNQQEYDDTIRELTTATKEENKAIDAERDAVEREEQIELRALRFEEDMAKLQEEGATELELKNAATEENRALDLEKEAENKTKGLISEELYKQRINAINKKYDDEKSDNEADSAQKLAKLKKDIAMSGFNALQSIVDKDSKAGKALALSRALMNTYQGVSAGVAMGMPQGIPSIIAAATTGFKAVKDIMKTKTPNGRGGSSSSAVSGASSAVSGLSAVTSAVSNLKGNQSNLSAVSASGNQAVQSQISERSDNSSLTSSVSKAVMRGAEAGTAIGSERGITNLSDNNAIQKSNSF